MMTTSTKKINRNAISPTNLQDNIYQKLKMEELKEKENSNSPKLIQQLKDNVNHENFNPLNNFYIIKGEKFREIKSQTPNNLYNTD
jgi:hypothetical protein